MEKSPPDKHSGASLTILAIYACKNTGIQRWGQAICTTFGLKDDKSYSSYVDALWHADDERVESIVQRMIEDLNIPAF